MLQSSTIRQRKAPPPGIYDPAGNILSKTVAGKTTTYTYDKANQLVSSKNADGKVTKYEYDAAGRMVKEGEKTFAYGWLDKVMQVAENGKTTQSYSYDISGQLATADYGDSKETFLWDGLALLSRNNLKYVNEPAVTGGNPILAGDKMIFDDMLGNTLGVKDGEKFSAIDRDAFGELKPGEKPNLAVNFFTGKPEVDGLGYSFLLRNYRADLGKWQTTDPLGYPDGWNNLAYCNNKVIETIDFLGAYEIEWEGTWTAAEKNAVTQAISKVGSRISVVISQISEQVTHLLSIREKSNVITERADALITKISELRSHLSSTLSNINSSTYNLEIYKKDLGNEVMATYWASPVPWYDDELTLHNDCFNSSPDYVTLFHELTHTWSEDGGDDNYMDAHIVERLYKTDFSRWNVYRLDYRKIFE